jgi:chromosome segregation ATPase
MNSVSSRSHAICTLNVTIAPLENNGEEEENHSSEMMKAKLTLVDLAGSERIKRTGAEGARMKEGININKGLFVLGQVVSALSEWGQQGGSKKSNAHIPYRDSKLTRLLQDSLGGNSRTVMIACISPAQSNAEETINTLRYAERTRNIKNSAVRNLVSGGLSSAEAAALRKENQQLKLELAQLRDGSVSASGSMRSLPSLGNTEVVTKLRAQCSSFLAENDLLKERIKSHSEEVLEASLRADKWQAKFERAVEMAEQHGVDLSDKIDIGDAESIVNQLRNQLSEAKTELLEARADAAMARATAGAVIAGKGDLESMSENLSVEMPALEEDESSDRDNITNELSAVSGTIEQKEAMLQQMLKERSCRETIQIHLQNSLRMLQTEVEDLTTEKSQLMLQMNQNMEDSSRRKCKTEVNPVTKRLREQIKSLESRINELKQKASEHQKSIRMKEEAEKKCARLTAEIAQDKRRRADLQKKLKEASNEIRAEKKAAQQNAARMMRDSQKLKIELHKIKSAAEKQAVVLKRKIDEAAAKEKARVELENKRKHVESMRLASASGDEIKESRKQELEAWIDREIECSRIKAQINDHQSQLESAMAERKRLMKSNSDTVDILQLENIEDDCNAIRAAISDLEDTAKKAFPAYENSNPAWRFIDSNLFKALSKHEAKHVMTYVFDMCSSVKHELDSVVADQEYKINLEIDAAVAKERQLHERDIMKLKVCQFALFN